MNIEAVKAKFQSEVSADPAMWAKFMAYVEVNATGIYKAAPVSVAEFFSNEYYCGDLAGNLYPVVLEEVEAMCSGNYTEGVLTGGIGCSKTTIALLTMQYTLYQLSLMHNPQAQFDLLSSDEIVFIFQSINASLAKSVDYERFKARIETSKYFEEHFPFDKNLKSELKFPNRIIVKPVSGTDKAAIGQNVFGGIIDECFVAGTVVQTAAGPRAIETLRAGAIVRGFGRRGWRQDTVRAVINTGVKEIVTVRLDNGAVLRVTPNHPIATPDGWVAAGALAPEQEVCLARTKRSRRLRTVANSTQGKRADLVGRKTRGASGKMPCSGKAQSAKGHRDERSAGGENARFGAFYEQLPRNARKALRVKPAARRRHAAHAGSHGEAQSVAAGAWAVVRRGQGEDVRLAHRAVAEEKLRRQVSVGLDQAGGQEAVCSILVRSSVCRTDGGGLGSRQLSVRALRHTLRDQEYGAGFSRDDARGGRRARRGESRLCGRTLRREARRDEELRDGAELAFQNFDRARVVRVEPTGEAEVFNLETERTHTFVANGVLTHNCNFMAYIEKSKQSNDGEAYDQAQKLYDSIARRRESRFMKLGKLPGMLCLVSSKRYPGEFTDRKMQEAREQIAETGKTTIRVYDKVIWHVQPDKFGPERFRVFIGDMSRQPHIMKDDEVLAPEDAHLELLVPTDYLSSFKKDIMGSLREIGGQSTMAQHPFMVEVNKISACFGKVESVMSTTRCDFVSTSCKLLPPKFRDIGEPRFASVDLGKTKDSAGVACGYVKKFVRVEKSKGYFETLPLIVYDFVLEVPPPKGGEINFGKIRAIFFRLRELGVPLKWITYDTFQSVDSIQILKNEGFAAGIQSMDTTALPYTILKSAIYDERVWAPKHDHVQTELVQLEYDAKTGGVDHPEHGSKDCISGDIGIPLLNGTTVPIRDLVGQEPWVYSCLANGRVVPAKARSVRLVGRLPAVRVQLDNGEHFDCTADHEIMLRDGSFATAADLRVGQSLMPLYRDVSIANAKSGLNGYERLWCNQVQKYVFTHHRVAEHVLNFTYGRTKGDRQVLHHADFTKRNNTPENLQVMGWAEHRELHNRVGATNLKALHQDPEFKAKNALRVAEIGRRTGRINITRYNKSEARIAKLRDSGAFAANGSKVMLGNWADPAFRARHKARHTGAANSQARKDITLTKMLETAAVAESLNDLYRRLNCSQKVVYRILREHDLTTAALQAAITGNHKVISVTPLEEPIDVYDMTVPGPENFAIEQGVFVHNCADAMAGVAYGLTTQRYVWARHKVLDKMNQALKSPKFGDGKKAA